MAKMSVKITLNPENPFEAKLIARLKVEKNMAGAIKVLAYERLVIQDLQGVITTARVIAEPESTTGKNVTPLSAGNDIDLEDLNQKVDRMFT